MWTSSMVGAHDSFKACKVYLYNVDEEMRKRVPDVEEFARYLNESVDCCVSVSAALNTPESLDVVIAVKPERQIKVWFVSERESGDPLLADLRLHLKALEPVAVSEGPIAFALSGSIGGIKPRDVPPQLPWPREWPQPGTGTTLDSVLARVWPSERSWWPWRRLGTNR